MSEPESDRRRRAAAAARRAFVLYEGREVAHRSCGIALAETFGRATAPYQILRRGGLTGEGECGAVRAGEQILGEILGDPDPTGAVTPSLRAAVGVYRDRIRAELPRGGSADLVCNHLTAPFPDFASPERAAFCAGLAERVALLVADTLEGAGHPVALPPPPTR